MTTPDNLDQIVHDVRGNLHAMRLGLAAMEQEERRDRRGTLLQLIIEEVGQAEANTELLIAHTRGTAS